MPRRRRRRGSPKSILLMIEWVKATPVYPAFYYYFVVYSSILIFSRRKLRVKCKMQTYTVYIEFNSTTGCSRLRLQAVETGGAWCVRAQCSLLRARQLFLWQSQYVLYIYNRLLRLGPSLSTRVESTVAQHSFFIHCWYSICSGLTWARYLFFGGQTSCCAYVYESE